MVDRHPASRPPAIQAGGRPPPVTIHVLRTIAGVFRYVWAAPTTALGLVVVLAGLPRARLRVVDGVLEAHSPVLASLLCRLPFVAGGAAAVTLGHVVIGRDRRALDSTRAHERIHVRQCERWGPLFVPAYLVAGLWAVVRGRDAYLGNVFEREAYQADAIRRATARARS